MKTKTVQEGINQHISPLCPRDNSTMSFEPRAIYWRETTKTKAQSGARELTATTEASEYQNTSQPVGSFHCNDHGCSVRYTPEQGYFTMIEVPEQPYFIEEPGANTLSCPIHKKWLYRREREHGDGFEWACGMASCDYCHTDVPGGWLRQ